MRMSAPVDLDLDGRLLVELGGGAAQGGRHEKHPQLPPAHGMDGEPCPRQHSPQVVHAGELAHGVEAPVEDAVARLKVAEQPPERLRCGPGLRGQIVGLRLSQRLPHSLQPRRVLPDEKLHGEVEGVERPGEGPQPRLVDLQPKHLADAELHVVQADGAVLVQVREHEEQGQVGRRLGLRLLRRVRLRCGRVQQLGQDLLRDRGLGVLLPPRFRLLPLGRGLLRDRGLGSLSIVLPYFGRDGWESREIVAYRLRRDGWDRVRGPLSDLVEVVGDGAS